MTSASFLMMYPNDVISDFIRWFGNELRVDGGRYHSELEIASNPSAPRHWLANTAEGLVSYAGIVDVREAFDAYRTSLPEPIEPFLTHADADEQEWETVGPTVKEQADERVDATVKEQADETVDPKDCQDDESDDAWETIGRIAKERQGTPSRAVAPLPLTPPATGNRRGVPEPKGKKRESTTAPEDDSRKRTRGC